jgi:hypothetical protein
MCREVHGAQPALPFSDGHVGELGVEISRAPENVSAQRLGSCRHARQQSAIDENHAPR